MANDNKAFRPEFWAAESVELLYENFIMAGLVHRDFSPIVAAMGDTVNTRVTAPFLADRKQNDLDDLETQDASATNIKVTLDQRVYVSFMIGDGEQSFSFEDLVARHLVEAIQAQVQLIDQAIAARALGFLGNTAGTLGGLTNNNGYDQIMDLRNVLNNNNVPMMGRNLVLGNNSETALLKNEKFQSQDYIGDGGRAVRDAYLGRIGGFDTFRTPNMPSVRNTPQETATTLSAAATAGATTVTVASAPAVGHYIKIAGDETPLKVINVASTTLTLNRPLSSNVGNGAAVSIYSAAAVNQSSAMSAAESHGAVANGYPAGWVKPIEFDAESVQQGQTVSFEGHNSEYVVIQRRTSSIMLDRPLEADVADNAAIYMGPDGEMNLGFIPKAITLVNRPLQMPMEGAGVRAAVAQAHGFGVRVTISYDAQKEGHRVTVGSLFGTKVLSAARGGVLLG